LQDRKRDGFSDAEVLREGMSCLEEIGETMSDEEYEKHWVTGLWIFRTAIVCGLVALAMVGKNDMASFMFIILIASFCFVDGL